MLNHENIVRFFALKEMVTEDIQLFIELFIFRTIKPGTMQKKNKMLENENSLYKMLYYDPKSDRVKIERKLVLIMNQGRFILRGG